MATKALSPDDASLGTFSSAGGDCGALGKLNPVFSGELGAGTGGIPGELTELANREMPGTSPPWGTDGNENGKCPMYGGMPTGEVGAAGISGAEGVVGIAT